MIFCGGIGHSTGRLRKAVGESPAYPWDTQELEDLTEAEIYARIACQIYKTDPADIYLDKESTNSGENAENALKIIKEHGIGKQILILIQDPLLQKRASASLKRYETESRIISYAPFISPAEGRRRLADGDKKFVEQRENAPADSRGDFQTAG